MNVRGFRLRRANHDRHAPKFALCAADGDEELSVRTKDMSMTSTRARSSSGVPSRRAINPGVSESSTGTALGLMIFSGGR
jgi:hypothetical protein